MPTVSKFWDKIAEKYSKRPAPDEAVYQANLEKTRANFTPESEVLEFGCGTGSTAIAHAPYERHNYATRAAAPADVVDYIEMFYNCKRRHGFNDQLSPVEYEDRFTERPESV